MDRRTFLALLPALTTLKSLDLAHPRVTVAAYAYYCAHTAELIHRHADDHGVSLYFHDDLIVVIASGRNPHDYRRAGTTRYNLSRGLVDAFWEKPC
jgi:hypothetical protein